MTGDLVGTPGSGGWMLLARDPGTAFDVPTSDALLNAWNGDLPNLAGYLSVSDALLALLAPTGQSRVRLDSGAWTGAGSQPHPPAECGSNTGCVFFLAGGVGVFFFPQYAPSASDIPQDLVIFQSASNGGVGCPMLSNTTYGGVATEGTAGAGDFNARSGAGCWGIPSTGPTAGEIWVQ